jgi:hypothetical protein
LSARNLIEPSVSSSGQNSKKTKQTNVQSIGFVILFAAFERRLKSLHSRWHIIASQSADELPKGCDRDATSQPRFTWETAFFDRRGQGSGETVFTLVLLVLALSLGFPRATLGLEIGGAERCPRDLKGPFGGLGRLRVGRGSIVI